ncbi:MAG: glycosyltransferase family 4 protein [Alphaproteobacteria bacterium]|nr:glycosyltransferase family 4 protein [Alphaproteobacteria bacterium]
MRLAFVDFVYGYDAGRPDEPAPLGGTTSAVCFLARALHQEGVSCTLFNAIETPRSAHGIPSLPLESIKDAVLDEAFDVYIFCGRWQESLVRFLRARTQAPFIAWMHESELGGALTPALEAFDGIVFVSAWQQRVNRALVPPSWRQTVIRNAMNPCVAASFQEGASILAAKSMPPLLLFAGNVARGAFHLPGILQKIRERRSDFSVEVFCDLNPSGDPGPDAAYLDWMRQQPNIVHVGPVGQTELARRMRRAALFVAPNPWPETSCIALIEAMASGLDVIATQRAALPETASGFARLIPIDASDDRRRFDQAIDVDAFADAVLESLAAWETRSLDLERRLERQVAFFRQHYQWASRVPLWRAFMDDLKKEAG